jgi:hypothetical protein
MPAAPASTAAPNIQFFMLPINPPFQPALILSHQLGFPPEEAWFLLPLRRAGYVLCKHRLFRRLRLKN